MSKYEEKMKALAVLKAAVDKVDDALEAIDAFADTIGIKPEKEKTVELPERRGRTRKAGLYPPRRRHNVALFDRLYIRGAS